MVNAGKKRNFKKILFSQGFLSLIGLLAIILISFPSVKNTVKQYRINKEISDFKKEIASLDNKNADLKNFVAYLESDQFAEEQARLNLNLKKTGEELTVIKIAANGLSSASTSEAKQIFDVLGYNKEKPSQELSNPRKWFSFFFK